MSKRKFGIIGEKIAQGYLINKEYKILETNFYTRNGEIDIIAQKVILAPEEPYKCR